MASIENYLENLVKHFWQKTFLKKSYLPIEFSGSAIDLFQGKIDKVN